IADNDTVPSVFVSVADSSGAEQGSDPIEFTVTRSNAFRQIDVVLTWSGAATFGVDYTVSATGGTLTPSGPNTLTLTLAGGATSASILVTPIGDSAIETAEVVTVTLGLGTGY